MLRRHLWMAPNVYGETENTVSSVSGSKGWGIKLLPLQWLLNIESHRNAIYSDDKYHHFVWAGIRYYLLVIYKTVPQITNWLLQCTLILFECLTLFEVIKKRSWLLYNHRLKNPDTFCFCCFYSNSGFFSVLYVKSCHYNLHLNWKLL